MRRFAFALIVALLTVNGSGVPRLVFAEPCSANEPIDADDGACPPTCVTCHCCAQAAEPTPLALAHSPESPVLAVSLPLRHLLTIDPRDILHVPRRTLL